MIALSDAFQNGCSAMAKTIVATTAMNYPKTVHLATRTLISSAKTIAACPNNGLATFPTTVVMAVTNWMNCAKESTGIYPALTKKTTKQKCFSTESAQSQSTSAWTASVFPRDGGAIMRTTAATIPTRLDATGSNAKMVLEPSQFQVLVLVFGWFRRHFPMCKRALHCSLLQMWWRPRLPRHVRWEELSTQVPGRTLLSRIQIPMR